MNTDERRPKPVCDGCGEELPHYAAYAFYPDANSTDSITLCDYCLDAFRSDYEVGPLDSDVIAPAIFQQMRDWAREEREYWSAS